MTIGSFRFLLGSFSSNEFFCKFVTWIMICDQRFLLGSSLWKTFWYLSWPLSLALVSTTLFDRYLETHLMIYLWLWCPCWGSTREQFRDLAICLASVLECMCHSWIHELGSQRVLEKSGGGWERVHACVMCCLGWAWDAFRGAGLLRCFKKALRILWEVPKPQEVGII